MRRPARGREARPGARLSRGSHPSRAAAHRVQRDEAPLPGGSSPPREAPRHIFHLSLHCIVRFHLRHEQSAQAV